VMRRGAPPRSVCVGRLRQQAVYFLLVLACARALAATLRVRAELRPSVRIFDAFEATRALVTRELELFDIGGSTSFLARVRCTLGTSLSRVKFQCPLLPTGEGAHRFRGRRPRGADRRVVHGQFFPARAKKKPTVAAARDCSGDRAATTLTKLFSPIPPKITARTRIT